MNQNSIPPYPGKPHKSMKNAHAHLTRKLLGPNLDVDALS